VTASPSPESAPWRHPPADLADFVAAGVLTDGEARLARRLGRLVGESDRQALLGAALALRAPRHGHVCVQLDRVAEHVAVDTPARGYPEETTELDWPEPVSWAAALRQSPLVCSENEPGTAPLVLDGTRLYLERYAAYERRVAEDLRRRAATPTTDVSPEVVAEELERLFRTSEASPSKRQRLAAATAAQRKLAVVAGGPGTGKTHTVVSILALLASAAKPAPRVALAAPTGKAAARLQETVGVRLGELDLGASVADVLRRTPASTLHRLLGRNRESESRFRHDANDPLPYDAIIVDEASMISLALMAKLVEAVPRGARLVLVGDRDQLASVEAGAVFGDVCGPAGSRPRLQLSESALAEREVVFGSQLSGQAEHAPEPGVWDAIVRLDRVYRFEQGSRLADVGEALQHAEDDGETVIAELRGATGATSGGATSGGGDRPGEVAWADPDARADARPACHEEAVEGYARFVRRALDGEPAEEVLDAFGELRVLCALRHGSDGARAWNEEIEASLAARVEGFEPSREWCIGRPLLVTENDHALRLYNGDVGVILPEHGDSGGRVVAFLASDGSVRRLSPARVPPCETNFAMTIHKSQGSQFGHTVVVLPEVSSRILTRELLYTGLTRAQHRATLLAREPILREAIARPVQRASGLGARLWPEAAARPGG
jgi:exodeoxyribonuclease V alpha subunit